MSGVAELGVVASVIQIADVGLHLSIKLYAFGEAVAGADKAIVSISRDIELTSSVLKELGEILKKESRLVNETAIQTTGGIVKECLGVFQEMEDLFLKRTPLLKINEEEKGTRTKKMLERLWWPYIQSKILLLRSNLERLKSTLILMLNVMNYAKLKTEKSQSPSLIASQKRRIEELDRSNREYALEFDRVRGRYLDKISSEGTKSEPRSPEREHPELGARSRQRHGSATSPQIPTRSTDVDANDRYGDTDSKARGSSTNIGTSRARLIRHASVHTLSNESDLADVDKPVDEYEEEAKVIHERRHKPSVTASRKSYMFTKGKTREPDVTSQANASPLSEEAENKSAEQSVSNNSASRNEPHDLPSSEMSLESRNNPAVDMEDQHRRETVKSPEGDRAVGLGISQSTPTVHELLRSGWRFSFSRKFSERLSARFQKLILGIGFELNVISVTSSPEELGLPRKVTTRSSIRLRTPDFKSIMSRSFRVVEISGPENFRHLTHVSWDPECGGLLGLPEEWRQKLHEGRIEEASVAPALQADPRSLIKGLYTVERRLDDSQVHLSDEDKKFDKRVKKVFGEAGYDEESIDKILKKAMKRKNHRSRTKMQIMDLARPTIIKAHRKHLSPETLDEYELPWEWDERDPNMIIIKRWIPEHDQEILFEHTRKIREKRNVTDTTVELKRGRDDLLLVRKKLPSKTNSSMKERAWMSNEERFSESDSEISKHRTLLRDTMSVKAEIRALEAEKKKLKQQRERRDQVYLMDESIEEGDVSVDEHDETVADDLLALWTTLPPEAPGRETKYVDEEE